MKNVHMCYIGVTVGKIENLKKEGKMQGRRRVFKSGPVEEIIECRRHERGESTIGGLPSR